MIPDIHIEFKRTDLTTPFMEHIKLERDIKSLLEQHGYTWTSEGIDAGHNVSHINFKKKEKSKCASFIPTNYNPRCGGKGFQECWDCLSLKGNSEIAVKIELYDVLKALTTIADHDIAIIKTFDANNRDCNISIHKEAL